MDNADGFMCKYNTVNENKDIKERMIKMNLRKILSVLLAVVMILSMVSIGAFAEESAVASIGDVTYSSLQAAVDAAENGQTVKLLDNIQISNGYNDREGIKVSGAKNITLDLNGKVLSQYVKDVGLSVAALVVRAETELTIVDSSEEKTGKISACSTAVQLEGTLNLQSGTIAVDATPSKTDANPEQGWAYVIWVYMRTDGATPIFNMTGGALKIGETQMSAHKGYDYANAIAFAAGADGVEDKYKSASVNISDGEIDGTFYVHEEATVIVTGGTFADADVSAYVPSGYVQDETTGKVTESAASNVAEVDGVGYETLQDAIDAAVDGKTVILLTDLTFESDLSNAGKGYFNVDDGEKVIIDLNEKTIDVTDNSTGNFIVFYNYGELTIKNGTVNLKSTNDRDWNAESAIVLNRGGILNIESGTYKHNGGTDMAFVVDNSGNWYGDATTNIYSPTVLDSSYIAIRNRMEQNSHGASGTTYLNVYGGTITGVSRAIWAQAATASTTSPATGEINISGGEVGLIDTPRSAGAECMTTISGGTVEAVKCEDGELAINGGTITGTITILDTEGNSIWTKTSDAGFYYVDETKYGLMRFLFHTSYEGEIAGSGIRYFNSSDITEGVNAGKGGVDGDKKAFYGDIENVPESALGNTYYALAYINIGTEANPQYIWSGAVECKPNFEKEFNYTPENTPEAGGNN